MPIKRLTEIFDGIAAKGAKIRSVEIKDNKLILSVDSAEFKSQNSPVTEFATEPKQPPRPRVQMLELKKKKVEIARQLFSPEQLKELRKIIFHINEEVHGTKPRKLTLMFYRNTEEDSKLVEQAHDYFQKLKLQHDKI